MVAVFEGSRSEIIDEATHIGWRRVRTWNRLWGRLSENSRTDLQTLVCSGGWQEDLSAGDLEKASASSADGIRGSKNFCGLLWVQDDFGVLGLDAVRARLLSFTRSGCLQRFQQTIFCTRYHLSREKWEADKFRIALSETCSRPSSCRFWRCKLGHASSGELQKGCWTQKEVSRIVKLSAPDRISKRHLAHWVQQASGNA